MKFKQGVSIFGLRDEMFFAIEQIDKILFSSGYEATVTSAVDGTHSTNSLHYDGRAIDIRIRDLPASYSAEAVTRDIQERLSDDYDVVLEDNHIHIEWQPKKG